MNLLDLFTGSGIGSLAATAAGINVVAQCENDPCCLYCLERLWPHAKQYTDVSTLTADALRRDGIGPIDIISGGFPCQDISTAGKGKGLEGERSGLWFQMRRLIDEIRPAWVLAENVPALRVRGADRVLDDLEELGYTCWPVVVGAHSVGAPHKRDRVWIVAYRPRDGQSGQRKAERADGVRVGPGGYEAVADARSQHTQCDTESWVTRCGESESSSGRVQLADAKCGRQREQNDEASPSHGKSHGRVLAGDVVRESVGLLDQESDNTNGKPHGSLSAEWVAQLMGWPEDYSAKLLACHREYHTKNIIEAVKLWKSKPPRTLTRRACRLLETLGFRKSQK